MSQNKDIEMSSLSNAGGIVTQPDKLNVANQDEDVIIGRFRKISSAKSMAATNGNIQYSTDLPPKTEDDTEAGLQFRAKETDKFLDEANANVMTKSSFRDVEKPSRFRDQPSATRFQMEDEKCDDQATEESENESGMDSDDPLTTDTKYGKSFRHFTREALPRLDNYRNVLSLHAAARPSLDELHNASLSRKPGETLEFNAQDPTMATSTVKFGWIKGVLMRCLLNIWGVMMFMRLTWIVGQAGLPQTLILILTTSVVTTITALSMSAICTNGVVKGGGTYYMISRSLGPEFGGSIGVIFSVANAVACAMYVVGFCDSLVEIIQQSGSFMIDAYWDKRIYGSITILVLTGIVMIGMEWEAKAQIVLLVILLAAIADFLIGSIIGPKSQEDIAQGFVGYNMEVLKVNLVADYREHEGKQHNFFTLFAIFFPAATGILAGANISGDLKDPQRSIPKGTLLAIFLTTLSYVVMATVSAWTVLRDATGNVDDLYYDNATNVWRTTLTACDSNLTASNNTAAALLAKLDANLTENSDCTYKYGLHHYYSSVKLVSGFGPLIYGGTFAATLSSALASLVSAPKVFQALCRDRLYPYIEFFGKGYGKNNEPVRGYVMTLIIALTFILIGDLDSVATLISNFFLAAYTLINFSTFHASLIKPLGWRPTFKYYNMWLSLIGSIFCLVIMFLIQYMTALITFACLLALYLLVSYRKPDVNWGSSTQAQTYKIALTGVAQLNAVTDHVKNYKPQILVLTGFPGERPILTDLTYLLTKGLSLMVCGHIVKGQVSHRAREALTNRAYHWFLKRKIKAFYNLVDDVSFKDGASALLQASGLGKLRPNILLMGFKEDWRTCDRAELNDYNEVMHKALDVHVALAVLRVEGGLRCDETLDGDLRTYLNDLTARDPAVWPGSMGDNHKETKSTESLNTHSLGSSLSDVSMGSPKLNRVGVSADPAANEKEGSKADEKISYRKNLGSAMRRAFGQNTRRTSSFTSVEHFTKRQTGTVDVWWLYDDGGLTLLLPYILSTRRAWASCPLRVFTLANKNEEIELEERNMASLLSKFRIDYSALKMIPDITRRPSDSTLAYFDSLIAKFKTTDTEDSTGITTADLIAAQDRTYRHLRLRELISSMSLGARLVCVTLPMPRRRNVVPAPLYHAWLHAIATAADRVLLIRGNHAAVLTFYS